MRETRGNMLPALLEQPLKQLSSIIFHVADRRRLLPRTLARTRTHCSDLLGCRQSCFNPRAREGRDCSPYMVASLACPFQSTRPRGARRIVWVLMQAIIKFQPTRPRGARLQFYALTPHRTNYTIPQIAFC